MKKPIVSVLLPVFNAQATLETCLDSIVRQTLNDFEAIVVNDGSTDETLKVIEHFQGLDDRIKVFSTPNRGIIKALNYGLEHCTGVYIARMDGDDIMHPNRLKAQLNFFLQHPEIDLLGCLVEGIPETTMYQKWSNSLKTNLEITSQIFVESPIMHPTFFARSDFFHNLGAVSLNG